VDCLTIRQQHHPQVPVLHLSAILSQWFPAAANPDPAILAELIPRVALLDGPEDDFLQLLEHSSPADQLNGPMFLNQREDFDCNIDLVIL
jgi:hypothetical protein